MGKEGGEGRERVVNLHVTCSTLSPSLSLHVRVDMCNVILYTS